MGTPGPFYSYPQPTRGSRSHRSTGIASRIVERPHYCSHPTRAICSIDRGSVSDSPSTERQGRICQKTLLCGGSDRSFGSKKGVHGSKFCQSGGESERNVIDSSLPTTNLLFPPSLACTFFRTAFIGQLSIGFSLTPSIFLSGVSQAAKPLILIKEIVFPPPESV